MKVSAAVEIPSHHRILFKPVDNCETDGCHMEVWLPDGVDEASKGAIPIASESQYETLLSNADKKAVVLHGGGYVLGACRDIPYNQVQYYLDHNIAVVTVEYRLLPQSVAS
jgi:acetyl esterase/lipase